MQRIWPIVLGTAAFFLICSHLPLSPSNIAWLARGDSEQHYLGWQFFRSSPWSSPVGANPAFGLELGSSIVFSDSIPLLAIPFKALRGWLPETFQYLGLWLYLCFVLQAYFAWKLACLVSGGAWTRLFAAGLFVFSPPMLWRLRGHESLVAHFLILAALYLSLRPPEKRGLAARWALLLLSASLVHPYLLAMVAAFWVAHLVGRGLSGETAWRRLVAEPLLIAPLLALTTWQAGYFMAGLHRAAETGGYGYFRTNLLSLFDASGWSHLLVDLPRVGGTTRDSASSDSEA